MVINESVSISQSPEKIWNFWIPVTTDVQWRKGITKAELTSKPPFGVGSTGIHYQKDLGPMPWTIIKWENGRRVTMQTKMELSFFMRIIMFFMAGKIKKSLKGDLQKLKEIMEKQK